MLFLDIMGVAEKLAFGERSYKKGKEGMGCASCFALRFFGLRFLGLGFKQVF